MSDKYSDVVIDDKFGGFDKYPDMTPEEAMELAAVCRKELEIRRQQEPFGELLELNVAASLAKVTQAVLHQALEDGELSGIKSLRSGYGKWRVYKKVLDVWRKKRNQCLAGKVVGR